MGIHGQELISVHSILAVLIHDADDIERTLGRIFVVETLMEPQMDIEAFAQSRRTMSGYCQFPSHWHFQNVRSQSPPMLTGNALLPTRVGSKIISSAAFLMSARGMLVGVRKSIILVQDFDLEIKSGVVGMLFVDIHFSVVVESTPGLGFPPNCQPALEATRPCPVARGAADRVRGTIPYRCSCKPISLPREIPIVLSHPSRRAAKIIIRSASVSVSHSVSSRFTACT